MKKFLRIFVMLVLCYTNPQDSIANTTFGSSGKSVPFLFSRSNLFATPDAPTNLVATGINTGGLIQFTAPANDGGSPITNYEYSTDNGATWITPSPAITSSPLIISSGLTNCTSYQVKIRAVNAAGTGTESSVVQLIPATSVDMGLNWATRTSAADNEWRGVTYGNGLFVAVASTGTGNRVMSSPDGITWTTRTSAADNEWRGVTYGNGLFVAVAQTGTGDRVMTSPDGITWTSRSSAADNEWRGVTYGNGLFVAVAINGSGNRVMTSPDGINWTSRSSAAENPWLSVTYGNGLFVAVAGNGAFNRVMTSPDGITWTSRTSAANNFWFSVTYGNGLFVAVSPTGSLNRVMTSPDGINWTSRTSAADNSWRSITYGNGLFVAVANTGTGNRVMTSVNGETWTAQTSAADNDWFNVTYGNGRFVAVALTGTGNRVMTSGYDVVADAPVITSATFGNSTTVNFTQSSSTFSPAITNYEYSTNNGSSWVALSPAATTSPLTITGLATVPTTILIRAVNSVGNSCPSNNFCVPPSASLQTFVGNKTVADLVATGTDLKWYDVATNGTALASTTAIATGTYYVSQTLNGCESARTSVTVIPLPSPGAPTNLVATGINTGGMIQFTAPANDGASSITNYEYSLDNGLSWVTPSPALTQSPLIITGLTNCTSYQVKLRAVNSEGIGIASSAVQLIPTTSVDSVGVNWTQRTSASNNDWNSVTYGNGLFVAVASIGTSNRVMTSPDGVTWTARTSAADNQWNSVTYGNGLFVAVAQSGSGNRVMTSPDGITWTARTSAADNAWTGVAYGNGRFVAVATTGTGNRVMTSPDGITWTSRSSAADNNWFGVTYGNGLFVAVAQTGPGTGNRVMTSPDGITWTIRTSAADLFWSSVTYGNGLFVAVAVSGTGKRVMTSPDGTTWTSQSSAADNDWRGVTYGNGLFVAVATTGTGNRVMTSPNGINWASRLSAADNQWRGVTYGNGLFVAVSPSGTDNRVMTSSHNVVANPPVISSVDSRNGGAKVFFTATSSVYAPSISNYEYSTDDGVTFTALNPSSNQSPITIGGLTNGSTYTVRIRAVNSVGSSCTSATVAVTPLLGTVPDAPTNLIVTPINTGGTIQFTPPVNDGGSSITNYEYSTDNGSTWTTPSPALTQSPIIISSGLTNCTPYQVKLRAINISGSGTASSAVQLIPATSVDSVGVNWTQRTSAADNSWRGVTYGNGLFVAVANSGTGNRVMTSPDGINWTSRTSAADNQWYSVTYGNGLFVAVAVTGTGNRVMTSPDGINWTSRTSAADNQWISVTYGNGLFVAVAVSGTGNRVMTSPDGINWTSRTSAADNSWNSVTYGNGLFVAVAASGTGNRVMTSPDGITWTSRTSAADNNWNSVTYGNGIFVAVATTGTGNRVMTSVDGETWTTKSSAADNEWRSVIYGNGIFVAVAFSGTGNRVMTSVDGETWTTKSSAADNEWRNVIYGNGIFVAVATNGTGNRVMTSSYSVVANAPVISSVDSRNGGAKVFFTATSSVYAPSISNYEYSTDDGVTFTALNPSSNQSPITIGGLTNGSTYVVRIRAVNSVGSSCTSSGVSVTPSVGTVPDAPTNLVATGLNTGGTIQFLAPANDGGSSITNYEYSTDNGNTWITPSPAITSSPLNIISGLTNCTSYQVKIRAVNAAGSGTASSAVQLIPATSVDMGVNWSQRTSAADNNWRGVTYGNGLFVAVANTGTGNRVMTSVNGETWTARTSAADNDWNSVTYGNGLFVAVAATGTGNRVMTSPDGITWTSRTSAADNEWTSVTYGNGLFVAVAQTGTGNRVMTSPDGITWTARSSAADNSWNSVTYGNSIFVAVGIGSGKLVMTSPDGVNWTSRTSAANTNWRSVTYGNGLFVAVSSDDTGNLVMTSVDGETWTASTSAANNSWFGVTYGNGLFVAVANTGTGNRVMTSVDGETWTARTSAADNIWRSITYGNGIFVAVGISGTGNRVMTSSYSVVANPPVISSVDSRNGGAKVFFTATSSVYAPSISNYEYSTDDGVTFTALNPSSNQSPITIGGLTNGSTYVVRIRAVNSVGSSCTSSGVSVTPSVGTVPDAPTNLVATGLNTGGTIQFLAPANDGGSSITNYEYSTDNGNTWITPSPAITSSPLNIISGLTNCTSYQVKIRAVNANGSGTASSAVQLIPATSVDMGVNWSLRSSAADNQWYSVTYGNGLFVAVAGIGTGNRVMTSPDGITWTARNTAANQDIRWTSVTYGNGLFVAVANTGSGNRVMTSPDGITWTSRTSAVDNNWTSVTYGNGLFVAVANSGTGNRVMTSLDGISWTSRTSAADNSWNSVTYGNGVFLAVAQSGTLNRVMTSSNGINWTTRTNSTDISWNSVTYGNGVFVAVAFSGTGNRVMTSVNGETWTTRTSAADLFWNSVTYGNGLFVAVASTGTSNRVMTSVNGETWTAQTSAADNQWRGVTYGNGLFVAVAATGTGNRVMTSSYNVVANPPVISSVDSRNGGAKVFFTATSSVYAPSISNYEYSTDDGVTFTALNPSSNQSPITIGGLTNGSTYVVRIRAVNSVGSSCTSSGVSVTPSVGTVPDAPTNLVATGLNTGGTIQFLAPANDGGSSITNYEYSTDNGNTWITPSPAITSSPLNIISGLTNCTSYQVKIRAVNANGSGTASSAVQLIPATSVDMGVNWTQRTSAADNAWSSVTYGNSLFVAVAGSGTGNRVMTSTDGLTWTSRTSAVDNAWSSITYGNGLFVAVAQTGTGNRVMSSPDGITWTTRTSATDSSWNSVTYGNGRFVAVTSTGVGNRVMTSDNGIVWTSRTSAADNLWTSVTYGNGLFVAVAASGTGNRVMTSPDGITWTSRTSAADNNWNSVTYGNGRFVAVATSGTGNRVMTSVDGETWTARTSAADNNWVSVTYGFGRFVAVASTGIGNRVMTSVDGETWTIRTSAADNSWTGVAYGNGIFVAVNNSGVANRVMTSSFSLTANAPVISSAPISQTEASVSFTQSASTFARAITNYRYSTDGGSSWRNLSPASSTSPITATGITDFANQIQLQAINGVGFSCPASYSLALVAINLNKYGQQSSIPSEFVNKNGARGISGIRATGESRINTPILSATAAVTDLTSTTATSGGTVVADGGAPVTARGVCWSTTANPTTADNKTVDGTGIGTFTSAITGLASGTTYYVRSYATNSMGTTYGPELILITL